jgi:FAD/FMN-containing dehydrogenase
MLTQTFVQHLQSLVGSDIVLDAGQADVERHTRDFLNVMEDDGAVIAVAYPRTTEQVSAILAACNAEGVPVVPQGGLTSMVGAALPLQPSLVLSMERMRAIEELDADAATITVEAGCVLETVQKTADEAGFFFPLDLGGRGTAQIGGLISTNAGGNRVLRYGMMRESVLGIEAVLPDGTIIRSLNKMLKNNAGYDLKHLFIGSEGTIGVVTRAVLRLFPKPLSVCTALVALTGYDQVLKLLSHVKEAFGGELAAFEAIWPDLYERGTVALGRIPPIAGDHGLYVLIETNGTNQEQNAAQFEAVLASALEEGLAEDVVIAASERQRADIWSIRDAPGEFSKMFWPQRSYDVSVPIGEIGALVEQTRAVFAERWPHVDLVFWGHIADSNLHLAAKFGDVPAKELDSAIFALVGAKGGSISAEHGIGSQKRDYLHLSRTDEEIALMRVLKQAIDGKNILNPGKVI